MSWKSPTGYVDESSVWTDEPKAYDGSLSTWAYSTVPANNWGGFLDLLIDPAILCDKVRLYPYDTSEDGYFTDQIQVDVYYGGAWHTIYNGSGTFWPGSWHEYSIPGGPFVVSKARVRFHNSSSWEIEIFLNEFDFNQLQAVRPLVGGSLAGGEIGLAR
jgi:hypothetical protein